MGSEAALRGRPHQAVIRFVSTGIAATLTHTAVVLTLVYLLAWSARWANFAAFLIATLLSYVLNSLWTFSSRMTRKNALRFVSVAAICAGMAALVADTVARAGYRPLIGIAVVVLVITPISFLLHRHWTYCDS